MLSVPDYASSWKARPVQKRLVRPRIGGHRQQTRNVRCGANQLAVGPLTVITPSSVALGAENQTLPNQIHFSASRLWQTASPGEGTRPFQGTVEDRRAVV